MTSETVTTETTTTHTATTQASRPPTIGFDALWNGDSFLGHSVFASENGLLHRVDDDRADHELGGALIPHLTDHHTHLGLTDPAVLFANGITDAVDLGWVPEVAAGWLIDRPGHPSVRIAGALITAPGGYPKNAGWGPPGSSAEVADASEAAEAVRVQLIRGASRIKVALNTDAGPTVDNSTLTAIVEEAHSAGFPVTIHAQGAGQAARALAAGADQFAHAPFTERLDDGLIGRAVVAGITWISTLDIHGWGRPTPEFAIAIDNVRRFAAAGGRILYGTDIGNGPLAQGVNERELDALVAAGLSATQLLQAITGDEPLTPATPTTPGNPRNPTEPTAPAEPTTPVGPRFAWIPTSPPTTVADLPAWLATARGHTTTTILGALA